MTGEALALGASGVWLDHTLFSQADPQQTLQRLAELIHPNGAGVQ
jgi:hypothetical protein